MADAGLMSVPPGSAEAGGARGFAIAVIGLTFFVVGFLTWLNGPLIAFVKLAFSLTDTAAFLVPMVFYMSYFVLALPSAALIRRTGMKRGMVLGLLVVAIGSAAFGQFVSRGSFGGALCGLFLIGAGLAILQTAANPYVIILGPAETAARRIAIMGICNKVAGILAPIVFGVIVMQDVGELGARLATTSGAARAHLLQTFSQRVHAPYEAMAALMALLAVGVLFSRLPEVSGRVEAPETGATRPLRAHRHLWLGALCLFLYVGAEVMAGDAIGTYGRAFGLPLERTTFFTSLTLTGMLAGYVAGLLAIPRLTTQHGYLAFSAALGLVLVVAAFLTTGYASVGCVAALGFANAMMWPAIFPLAIRDLGRHVESGAALLIMAISGGAIAPQLFVLMKQFLNFQVAFASLMLPAYGYILFYATCGWRD